MSACRQSGIALLTVLLVVFLASVAAVSLASLQQLVIRRSTLLSHHQQAQLYAHGVEHWAAAILLRDLKQSQTDHLNEDWATLPPALPVEGGSVSGQIEDLQGRFNLNSLLKNQDRSEDRPQDEDEIDRHQLEILHRLLEILELNPGIAQAIADWIDSDIDPRFPDGAEDSEYVSRTPPYLAANRPMASISELRLIKGIDQEAFDKLAPHVSALPPLTDIKINVNTASAQVLASLSNDLDLIRAEALVEEREREPEGYADVDAFLNAAGLTPGEEDPQSPQEEGDLQSSRALTDVIAVNSQYFLVRAEANIGEGRAILNSVLHRSGENARILRRSFGNDEP